MNRAAGEVQTGSDLIVKAVERIKIIARENGEHASGLNATVDVLTAQAGPQKNDGEVQDVTSNEGRRDVEGRRTEDGGRKREEGGEGPPFSFIMVLPERIGMALKTGIGKEKKAAVTEEVVQIVTFHVGEEEYGLDIGPVAEVIRPFKITPLPRMPEFVEGVINLRGSIIPIVDMRRRLSWRRPGAIRRRCG